MNVLLAICATLSLCGLSGADSSRVVHGLFTEVLREHVVLGKVNYAALQDDSRLDDYIEQLSVADPGRMEDDDRLAFWLNVYNAFTLKIICDNYPLKSINELHQGGLLVGLATKRTIWDSPFVVINQRRLTLNEIEHKIIRPEFKDARIHFALVCAAVSCPPLRSEAYEGYKLNRQLNDQARLFFSQQDKNFFDREARVAHLSRILDWYGDDFGPDEARILLAIAPYLSDELAEDIRSNSDRWRIEHTRYNWDLNE